MRAELRSKEAREAMVKLLSSLGMIYPENGRYTPSAHGIEYFAARMAAAVVWRETDGGTTQRFCNALEDLCSLGAISVDETPQKVDGEHSAPLEEAKCVDATGKLMRCGWCVLSPPHTVQSGHVEVDEPLYFPWEEDLLCAIRLFAHFRRFTPDNWRWPARHITLKWKSPPLRDDYLLGKLLEETGRLEVHPGKRKEFDAFVSALHAAVQARIALLAGLPNPWARESKPKGLKALLEKLKPAPKDTLPAMCQRFDSCMQTLCSTVGYV